MDIGSRLWLLSRAKQTPAVLALAKDYAGQAVKWLVDDGVCSAIDVSATFFGPGRLGVQGVFHRPGADPVTLRYAWVWSGVS